MNRWARGILIAVAALLVLWLALEIGLRLYVELPLKTDFYGSIKREDASSLQQQTGIKVSRGPGWVHLGWIADPDQETYRVERFSEGKWNALGAVIFGSYLAHQDSGRYRVWAVPLDGAAPRMLGEVDLAAEPVKAAALYKPVIAGPWQALFKPQVHGYYINDHAVYRDAKGDWRLAGITHKSDGNFNEEKYFAVGSSREFPPGQGMTEDNPVADFGELAWAPHVISENGTYYMFWSPHRLERMVSTDGVNWGQCQTVLEAPYHRFFRDGMVLKVAEGQWLLYTTARDQFFSQVDIYQSFDLRYWQYTGAALQSTWGSERNSPFASTESPFVIQYRDRYYLSLTYNNDTFFWNGLLLPLKIWPDRPSYNDTLVFQSANPYDFGIYGGRNNAPTLVTRLESHGPEYIYLPERDRWYITTAGWPWVSSLTKGEAAVAPLQWEPVK